MKRMSQTLEIRPGALQED